MASMAVDRARRGSNALWMATAVFALAGVVLTLVGWRDMIVADGLANVASGLAGVAYATIGALIVRRTGTLEIRSAAGRGTTIIGRVRLQGVADRREAIGGALAVRSTPGVGTTITGHVSAFAMETA